VKTWSGSDGVNQANLNSTFSPEAIVKQGISDSGAMYSTIQGALNAGHRSIYIYPGHYDEQVQITNPYTKIVCARPGRAGQGTTGSTVSCKRVWIGTADDSLGTSYVTIDGLTTFHVEEATPNNYGWIINGGSSYLHLIDCGARGHASQGFRIGYNNVRQSLNMTFERCFALENDEDGFLLHDLEDWEVTATFIDCWSYSNGGDGYDIISGGTATNVMRHAVMLGCRARSNAYYGTRIGGYVTCALDDCQMYGNAGGVRVNDGSDSYPVALANSHMRGNSYSGISLSVPSSWVTINGCSCVSTGTKFLNCGSSPGYVFGGEGTNT
jgi:hypothetical protein